jgi:hypothetical protein
MGRVHAPHGDGPRPTPSLALQPLMCCQVLFIFLGVAAVTIPIGIVCLVYGLKVSRFPT